MSRSDLLQLITERATTAAASLGLDVWGIDLSLHNRPLARIFVDKKNSGHEPQSAPVAEPDAEGYALPEGVSIEECAELSRMLGLALDVDSVFADAWVLEVSSPGFERLFFSLEQLKGYIGSEIEATLSAPVAEWPGRKKFKGALVSVGDYTFTLKLPPTLRKPTEPELAEVPWDSIRRVHLVHTFADAEKPGKEKAKAPKKAAK